jgi:predicted site-specific integrase-resolvase
VKVNGVEIRDVMLCSEVAAVFGVDVSTVDRWRRTRAIPAFELPGGNRWRFRGADVVALLGGLS